MSRSRRSIDAPWRSRMLWLAKLRMPPGPGPTSHSRPSLWTRPASATISRTLTLIWAVSTLTVDSPPKQAEALEQAIDHLDRLVREQPGRAGYRHLLAKTHYELGRLHQSDGQITRAAAAWNRSRELLQVLVREHPADSNYRYNLATDPQEPEHRLRRDRPAGRGGGNPPVRPGDRGAVDPGASGDRMPITTTRPRLTRAVRRRSSRVPAAQSTGERSPNRAADLALGMLVEAEKAGYFRSPEGVELLKTDESLDPLRSRDGFRQLLARVLAASAPQAK